MAIEFNSLTRHGTREFLPNVALAFPADVEDFFIKAGFAKQTDAEPVHTYEEGEVEFDPETRNNVDGKLVVDNVEAPLTVNNPGGATAPAGE